jgi:cell division initiation protein
MKLTPLDIQQQQFRTTFWGFDQKEVDAFLDLLATDVEELIRNNNSLREELKRKDAELQEHRERERTLKETMITATRITEDIKQNARKEAEIIIGAAEAQAEQIIQNAHTRLVRIMEDIDELRRQKAQFEGSLGSILSTHQKLLEAMTDREQVTEAETLMLLGRRIRSAQSEVAAERTDETPVSKESSQPPKTESGRTGRGSRS